MSIICLVISVAVKMTIHCVKLLEHLIKKYNTKLIPRLGDNFYPDGVKSVYEINFLTI